MFGCDGKRACISARLEWTSLDAPLRQALTTLPDQRDGGCELAEG
jgi:hypothetical protein